MIQHPDIYRVESLLELLGDKLIGMAGLCMFAGVVMSQNHGGRVDLQDTFDDFSRIDIAPNRRCR